MDMSAAALPPVNAPINESDRKHPRFMEYMRYRSGMAQLMVNCPSFESWLNGQQAMEDTSPVVFQVKPWRIPVYDRPDGWLQPGWYKHEFSYTKAGGRRLEARFGPYGTKQEAEFA